MDIRGSWNEYDRGGAFWLWSLLRRSWELLRWTLSVLWLVGSTPGPGRCCRLPLELLEGVVARAGEFDDELRDLRSLSRELLL